MILGTNEEKVSMTRRNKDTLFILDNATIHKSKMVKEKLIENYNILFLPPYSPFLNIIEIWFS